MSRYYLARPTSTPPFPDIDRLRGPFWTRRVVVRRILGNTLIQRTIQNDEGDVGQLKIVNLIEGLLAHIRVSRALLLFDISFHLLAAVEAPVLTIYALLRAIQERSIIGIVRIRILKLAKVMLPAKRRSRLSSTPTLLHLEFSPKGAPF